VLRGALLRERGPGDRFVGASASGTPQPGAGRSRTAAGGDGQARYHRNLAEADEHRSEDARGKARARACSPRSEGFRRFRGAGRPAAVRVSVAGKPCGAGGRVPPVRPPGSCPH